MRAVNSSTTYFSLMLCISSMPLHIEQILEDGVEGLFVALLVDVDVDGLVGVVQAGSFEVTVD